MDIGVEVFRNHLFWIESPKHPHVSRSDGGHLMIHPNTSIESRWELPPQEAAELMRLSMWWGKAMLLGMCERGIPVERINFQDNGNWAIGEGKRPTMHLHLYGRARDSIQQAHGEALYFPPRASEFYKQLEPLHEADLAAITAQASLLLEREPLLRLESWPSS